MEKGHSGNAEPVEETGDVWENIEMVSGLSPVSISSTFLGETGDILETFSIFPACSQPSPVSPGNAAKS